MVAWGAGVWFSIQKRAWAILLFAAGTGAGSLAVWLVGSPWIQGKALATGTASFLVIAMVGISCLVVDTRTALKALGLALLLVAAPAASARGTARAADDVPAGRANVVKVSGLLDRHVKKERIDAAIAMLVRSGKVVIAKEKTAGRPVERIKLA